MWLEMMFAVALGQEPTVTIQSEAPVAVQTVDKDAGAVAQEPRRRARRAEGVACRNRAPTGSVLRQNICTTSNRRESESRAAQDYIGSLTRGTVNEPPPLEFGPR